MHLKLIINPVAGGITVRKSRDIIDFFKRNTASASVDYTTKPHEATNLAQMAVKQNFDAIVAVGGDGTVNEVVNGIAGAQVALGIIPGGSANDFSKELNIPANLTEACQTIIESNTKRIDMGKVNDRYFINVAGVGLDAQVSEAANESTFKVKGWLLYVFALSKVLIASQPKEFNLALDGKSRRIKAWQISVGNGGQFGGGMKIAPIADTSDGLFDVCVIKDVSKWSVFYYLPLVILGKHLSLSNVALYRAKEVEIISLGCLGHADGEVIKGDIFKFELLPQALDVIVPGQMHA